MALLIAVGGFIVTVFVYWVITMILLATGAKVTGVDRRAAQRQRAEWQSSPPQRTPVELAGEDVTATAQRLMAAQELLDRHRRARPNKPAVALELEVERLKAEFARAEQHLREVKRRT